MHWAGMKWTGTWSAGDLGRLFNSHYWFSKRQPTQLRQAHCRYDRPKVISRQRIVEILTARRRAGDDVVASVTDRSGHSPYNLVTIPSSPAPSFLASSSFSLSILKGERDRTESRCDSVNAFRAIRYVKDCAVCRRFAVSSVLRRLGLHKNPSSSC